MVNSHVPHIIMLNYITSLFVLKANEWNKSILTKTGTFSFGGLLSYAFSHHLETLSFENVALRLDVIAMNKKIHAA